MDLKTKYHIGNNLRGQSNKIGSLLTPKTRIKITSIVINGKATGISYNEALPNPFWVDIIPSTAENQKIRWESNHAEITFSDDFQTIYCGEIGGGGFDVELTAISEDNPKATSTTLLYVNAD